MKTDSSCISVSEEELGELVENGERVRTEPWRHGTRETFHVTKDGTDYLVTVCVHREEGIQDFGKLIPAVQRTREVTEWVPDTGEAVSK